MKSGIWLIDKPAGISSAGALAALKRRLRPARIGHAGTLDPMATGLLVVLVNGATRLAHYAESGDKTYAGTIDLGAATATDDVWGEVIASSGKIPPFAEVEAAGAGFLGEILQVPPAVSAVKVEGQRAYRLARRGQPAVLTPRAVRVHSLRLAPVSARRVFFRMVCSKGTYVRSIARDLGQVLGCGACLSALRREASAPFDIRQAGPPDQTGWEDLLDWPRLFPQAPRVQVSRESAMRLRAGDQAVLFGMRPVLGRLAEGAAQAVYEDAGTREACGLLVRGEHDWRLAVNL